MRHTVVPSLRATCSGMLMSIPHHLQPLAAPFRASLASTHDTVYYSIHQCTFCRSFHFLLCRSLLEMASLPGCRIFEITRSGHVMFAHRSHVYTKCRMLISLPLVRTRVHIHHEDGRDPQAQWPYASCSHPLDARQPHYDGFATSQGL